MLLTIIIAFFCLIGLIILHELGHFITAKYFGVRVEEFGIGYPPRIFGKKIGETIYSLNLLPFGAFVRMPGEIGGGDNNNDPRSFSNQAVWKRVLITLGGVVSFWVIAAILLSIVFGVGASVVVDEQNNSHLINAKIQIADIASHSPAEKAGLAAGDTIKKLSADGKEVIPLKISDIQNFTKEHLGKEVVLTIERGKEVFNTSLVPRISPPQGEGAMGLALVKTAIVKYPWYLASWQGISKTVIFTGFVFKGYYKIFENIFRGLPSNAQLVGPVGIFHLMDQASRLGLTYFLNFLAVISIYLAVINILPIPSLDGGKLIFLGIEAVRKKPVSQKVEGYISSFFFTALILLMIWVTIKDINRIF